ncbi:MAG: hypothetical protein ACOCYN_04310, partial [Planctomycetota bacterium]
MAPIRMIGCALLLLPLFAATAVEQRAQPPLPPIALPELPDLPEQARQQARDALDRAFDDAHRFKQRKAGRTTDASEPGLPPLPVLPAHATDRAHEAIREARRRGEGAPPKPP